MVLPPPIMPKSSKELLHQYVNLQRGTCTITRTLSKGEQLPGDVKIFVRDSSSVISKFFKVERTSSNANSEGAWEITE